MGSRKVVVTLCALAAFVELSITITRILGREKCWKQPWYEKLSLYVFDNEKLQMCQSPAGQFSLGLETVAESKAWLLFCQLALMIVLFILPMIMKRLWSVFGAFVCMLTKNPKIEHCLSREVNIEDFFQINRRMISEFKKCQKNVSEVLDCQQTGKEFRRTVDYIQLVIKTDE
ncbi:hypothetical protein ScPMuIL_003735 [Solemya velum]